MKKKIIITILLVAIVLVLKNLFWGTKEVAIEAPTGRTAKIVQTALVGKSAFSEQVHVTGRVAAVKEAVISTQWTGFIGSSSVKIGDTVVAGQVLAHIADTYGLSGNAIDEAALGVTSAGLTRDNSLASLDQALENARVAYERAQKDYDSSKLSTSWSDPVSKAELDLQSYIAAQEKTLSGYETTYQSQLQNFQSLVSNIIDTSDTLLGVSEAKSNQDDLYENFVGAIDTQQKSRTQQSLLKLIPYKNWSPDPSLPLVDRVQELQKVYLLANEVLSGVKTILINTVTDTSHFTPANLATQKATFDGFQTQYSTITGSLVTFLNSAQSFLATYEKDRLSRETGVKTTAENSLNALELAKKAYETAQKARDIGDAQGILWRDTASIRLQNATGNAAKMNVTAPFSGVIITKNAEIGSLASPGANLFTIGDTSSMIVKIEVSVENQKYLRTGQDIPLQFGGSTFTGKLSSLSAGPDPQTHLYKAEIALPKVHPEVHLGDVIDVLLPGKPASTKPEDAKIVIPYTALRNLGQETYAVYVVDVDNITKWTGTVRERIVKIGETNETSVTIIEGLSVGDYVITLWTLGVEDGDYVQDTSLIPAIDSGENAEKDTKAL